MLWPKSELLFPNFHVHIASYITLHVPLANNVQCIHIHVLQMQLLIDTCKQCCVIIYVLLIKPLPACNSNSPSGLRVLPLQVPLFSAFIVQHIYLLLYRTYVTSYGISVTIVRVRLKEKEPLLWLTVGQKIMLEYCPTIMSLSCRYVCEEDWWMGISMGVLMYLYMCSLWMYYV